MKKTYLITGAGGFIGSQVASHYVDNGHDVYTVDNFSTGEKSNVPKGVKVFEGSCQDSTVIKLLSGIKFDCVMHLAGQSSGEISFDDPVYDLQTNCQSTLMLLKMCMKQDCKKFVYASSMSVYGDQPKQPVDEHATLKPNSFYAVGKIASENYMKIYSRYGINTTALRMFNVYGNGQNMSNLRQGMVSIFLAQAIDKKAIQIRGKRDRFRDLIHIDDVVNAFTKIDQAGLEGYHEYNIGTGVKTHVYELVDELLRLLPFEVNVEYKGNTEGDTFGIFSDITKIKNELGWVPQMSLSKGLKDMIEWALTQRVKL